ncbi:NADH-quinone oxidoreductase subunit L [Paenibacillus antri]|uniref:NADH-quinone oxidoreductase subunit L n=1 Tax=Paenibacillus antri TaxID=2582848 RepID=A0A5R9GD08_9BACL|nr:NADH-quinone oxidoreductase subunit L [Paenibacillus antri]TLS50533.1 NADH-quinone oxidoreductase subunit L [Paenibacillus antri]
MDYTFVNYAWLIPVFPLLSFLILTALGKGARKVGPIIGVVAAFVSLGLALLVFFERMDGSAAAYTWEEWRWLDIGSFSLYMGFEVTNLNALMLVVVTLVSALVNLYSLGYMAEDERISTFFAYVSLFTFSMLGLVLSSNIVMLYIFWELVGACSFLLIGFWYYKPEAKAAAKKAFIVTRIGDVGLFIGILLLFWAMPGHQLDFSSIHNAFEGGEIDGGLATWIALLIFVGAVGKSGQFPLHTWLPDAMEGPTPISALIHAATMVAAGVYLVARTYDIFLASSAALEVVAYVGAFTALFAATIAVAQNDIKRVLAYSTVSQLGYMMLALGMGSDLGMAAGIFHLFTHAFFKALLFLGAGSVIHGVHNQDIREMGGLFGKMKITAVTFAIGTLALSGLVPFAGFWSKDAILSETLHHGHTVLFAVGLLAAFFTAFYMTRLYVLVFLGKSRAKDPHAHQRAHESPLVMTLPLVVLAVLAVVAGFVNVPGEPWLAGWLTGKTLVEHANWIVIILSNAAAIAGILIGYVVFRKPNAVEPSVETGPAVLRNKYYIDEIYQAAIAAPYRAIGQLLHLFDTYVVDGAVKLVTAATNGIGRVGTRLQNGQMQTYGLIMLLGCLVFIAALAGRRFL